MYALADKYDLPLLKELARKKFEKATPEHVLWMDDKFDTIVKLIYTTTLATDRGLRNIVVRSAAEQSEGLLGMEMFEKMMDGIGEFGKDLWKYMFEHRVELGGGVKTYQCPSDHFVFSMAIADLDHEYFCPQCRCPVDGRAWH